MDVQPQSRPNLVAPAAPAEQKLTIEKFADGPITCLRFSGTIDESFDGKKLASTVECEALVLDTGGVKKISSFGIREWVDFVGAAAARAKQTVLIECSPKVVDQLNMVTNFAGSGAGTGRVFSFYAPFRCDYCDSEHRVLLDVAKDFESIKTMKLAERPCPACREAMYFDDDGSTYFSYVLGQGAFELAPELVQFLAAKLDYRVGALDAKLKVDKVIDGRITYLRFTGDLNNTFPRDKLAEGLEGTAIVDLTAVPRVDPAGAAAWRGFVQQVAPLVEQIALIGVAPAVLERICTKEDLGAKAAVLDFVLPYACPTCGTTSGQTIEVVEHADVLKFATAPELRCPACKGALQCTASEALMTILPGLPKPAVAKELARQIGELRHRKLERRTAGSAPLPRPRTVRPGGVRATPWWIGLVVVALAGVGYVAYSRLHAPATGPYGLGPVAGRSAPEQPAWTANAALGAATCNGTTCVGVSEPLASQEEAEDEASDAAYEGVAYEVAGDGWLAHLAPQLVETRAAALAAVDRDARSAQARRDVHDGRHAVARMFRRTAPPIAARYWESFDTADGKKFVAFAQVSLGAADAKRLAGNASQLSNALGATVVDLQPELGWRFPKLDHGVVVIKLVRGPLQEIGLAEHYIILAIDGIDVADAASFAKLANDEYTELGRTGGTLRVLVQTETGDPREFSTQIGSTVVAVPSPQGKPHGSAGEPTPVGGAVNVWDRYGGNRGSGRDDPTQ